MPDSLEAEDAASRVVLEDETIGLVCNFVAASQPPIEDNNPDCTQDGEERDDSADPKRPSITTKVLRDDISG